MAEINQLTAVTQVYAADQVPIYSAANGDARKASMTVIAQFVQDTLAAPGGFMTQYAAPIANAFSITINPSVNGESVRLLVSPTGGFSAGTIVLPEVSECADGQQVLVSCTQTVSTLTIDGNGAVVNGASTAISANGFFRLQFDGVFSAWYRIG